MTTTETINPALKYKWTEDEREFLFWLILETGSNNELIIAFCISIFIVNDASWIPIQGYDSIFKMIMHLDASNHFISVHDELFLQIQNLILLEC